MATIIHLYNNIYFSVLWQQKVNILAGIFLGLTIYSYFYKRKKIKKEIFELRKQGKYFQILTQNLINLAMSEQDKFSIKEMLGNMSERLRSFEIEMRGDIKELVKTFHDYEKSNNERIAKLEKQHGIVSSKLAVYVGFAAVFVMLVINTYMTITGK